MTENKTTEFKTKTFLGVETTSLLILRVFYDDLINLLQFSH